MSEASPASEAAAVAQLDTRIYPHLHALKSDKSDIDSYHYHSQHYHSFKLLTTMFYHKSQYYGFELVQQRLDNLAAKQFEKQFRSICHLEPAIFEDTKRGRSPVKKKATAPPTTTPPTSGPLTPLNLAPP